jgi:hypothetical protein
MNCCRTEHYLLDARFLYFVSTRQVTEELPEAEVLLA